MALCTKQPIPCPSFPRMAIYDFITYLVWLYAIISCVTCHSWITCTDYVTKNDDVYDVAKCRGFPRAANTRLPKTKTFAADSGKWLIGYDIECRSALSLRGLWSRQNSGTAPNPSPIFSTDTTPLQLRSSVLLLQSPFSTPYRPVVRVCLSHMDDHDKNVFRIYINDEPMAGTNTSHNFAGYDSPS